MTERSAKTQSPEKDVAVARVVDTERHADLLIESKMQPVRVKKGSPDFVDRVVRLISKCEGCHTSVNWDDNNAGISVGIAQWNQKKGEMPDLYERWAEKDPERFKAVFGPYAVKMRDEEFIRSANIQKGSDLADRILKSLSEPSMEKLQVELLQEKVKRAGELAREHGHGSERFVAQVADLANQLGWGGVRAALKRSKAVEVADEEQAVKALQDATQHKRANGKVRDNRIVREFSSTQPA